MPLLPTGFKVMTCIDRLIRLFICPTDADGSADPLAGDTSGGASAAVLDSWEDGASSTPEDGTAKPIVENDVDIDADVDIDGDEEKPKPVPKKAIELSEPKPKKEHINIVIIGHVGKTRLVLYSYQLYLRIIGYCFSMIYIQFFHILLLLNSIKSSYKFNKLLSKSI